VRLCRSCCSAFFLLLPSLSPGEPLLLARWATGAANAKKVKCGPRYLARANRSLQVFFLRRSLHMVMATVYRALAVQEGQEAVVPDFHAMSNLSEVRGSSMFGPQGPGYVPGFGRVSV
jgi:hypothetical protein